jgi:hypothetical protein
VRTFYFWTERFALSQERVRKYAPRATWIRTPPIDQDPQGYARAVRRLWGQDAMMFIEQDIVIRKTTVPSMRDCDADWCVFPYTVGANGFLMKFGLGCTKFSLKLQEALDYEKVFTHGMPHRTHDCNCSARCSICPCYRHQDTIIRHELAALGLYHPHVHEPAVRHQHDYTGGPDLLDDSDGMYVWAHPNNTNPLRIG